MNRFVAVTALCSGLAASSSLAQSLAPNFAADYDLTDLGAVPGVPAPYGGLTLKLDDPNTLLIGGLANSEDGAVYRIGLARDGDGHITGFVGTSAVYGEGPNIDGGLAYGPSGAMLFARFPINHIGQWKPGETTMAVSTDLTPLGVASSMGSLVFVPAGQPGAGRLKVASYNSGTWYDLPYTLTGDGTYSFGPASLRASGLFGPEGMIYVPRCSPGFFGPSILLCEYSGGSVGAIRVDAQGDPIMSTREDFITGLFGAEGALLDPITGDFLFATFGAGSRVIRVTGFPRDCPADINDDCFLNGDDFDAYVAMFEAGDPGADYNADGFVSGDDFDAFVADFESGC